VRARCVGVGLVYRAPVAAATKAARAGGYAVLTRRTVPGDVSYQWEEGGGGRGRKDSCYRDGTGFFARPRPCLYRRRVCVFTIFPTPSRVLQPPPGDIVKFRRHFLNPSRMSPEPVQGW